MFEVSAEHKVCLSTLNVSLTVRDMCCGITQKMDRSRREMKTWKTEVNKAKKKARELYSLRCDMQHKLKVSCNIFLPSSDHCNLRGGIQRLLHLHQADSAQCREQVWT